MSNLEKKYTVFPFGPQHPVLPEPIQLTLKCDEERVVDVSVNIGYVHRGIERAAELNDYRRNVYLASRVCGICNFMHALCYCMAIEEMMDLDVPERAKFLRVFWSELSRVQSHLLWLGLFADAIGFESLFMQFWREREFIMDLQERTGGNRVMVTTNVIGGVNRDVRGELANEVERTLVKVRERVKALEQVILRDPAFKKRTVGTGYLSSDMALKLGAVGPVARGSGLRVDVRMETKLPYSELEFEPIVEKDGDSYARTLVRYYETLQSIDLMLKVMNALRKMEDSSLFVKPKEWPEGETISRVEQPRGELFYYVKANGTPYLERLKIRTPTLANIPPVLAMLPGCEIADVPVILHSIDPCISCTERYVKLDKGGE
ncbi:MAG: nickel-dependent hydrogenase large subunit [Candidatus Korarchaeum sp.]